MVYAHISFAYKRARPKVKRKELKFRGLFPQYGYPDWRSMLITMESGMKAVGVNAHSGRAS
jgi:hypothetical protein